MARFETGLFVVNLANLALGFGFDYICRKRRGYV